MRALKSVFAAVLFLAVAGAGLLAAGLYYAENQFKADGPPAVDGSTETVVLFEPGLGLKAIAARLHEQDLVRDPRIFELGVRLRKADKGLRAGEYAIPSGASMLDIMEILRSGQSIQYAVTIPEGQSVVQVFDIIGADPVLTGELSEIPPEGSILPETYFFTRGTTRGEILARMRKAHDALLDASWETRADDLPLKTKEEAVILASIVEKETGVAEERPLVASVFINRLKKGIRLQSDPTIIYGITKGRPLGRRIRLSELNAATPYNTYQVDGLPPTPIANPGRASLEAVLNPPETDYLFFVADGSGGHVFASTLAEHNRNVLKWRQYQRENGLR